MGIEVICQNLVILTVAGGVGTGIVALFAAPDLYELPGTGKNCIAMFRQSRRIKVLRHSQPPLHTPQSPPLRPHRTHSGQIRLFRFPRCSCRVHLSNGGISPIRHSSVPPMTAPYPESNGCDLRPGSPEKIGRAHV